MSAGGIPRTGGQVLVDQLRIHGVDTAFCVPGESYLATLDALYGARNAIRMITCRQEGGVTNMAEAYGKMTGKPGIAFVTRGPGACNGSIGVHTAMQDSTPMVVFIGQVAREQEYREAAAGGMGEEIRHEAMIASFQKPEQKKQPTVRTQDGRRVTKWVPSRSAPKGPR